MSPEDFRRLLDRFGRTREVLAEAEEAERIASANRLRQEANELEGQIIAEVQALAAERDRLEADGSRLTREITAAQQRIVALESERNEFRDSALMYAAMVAERNEERDQLEQQLSDLTREVEAKNRRLIELESRPVSAPPARRGPLPPAAIWGTNAVADAEGAGITEDGAS